MAAAVNPLMPDPWSMVLPLLAVVFLLALAGIIAVVVRGLLPAPRGGSREDSGHAAARRPSRNERLADLRELHSRGLLSQVEYDAAVREALQDFSARRPES
jgi:hypothetical protein